jgi:GMP synthase (glutamine-hydrolysing)
MTHAENPQRPIAIIQMGFPPEAIRAPLGDQADWFAAALGAPRRALRVVQPFQGDALPAPSEFSLAIVTGSWAMVTDREAWSERTAAWLRTLIDEGKPLLGVCYGHQLMAHALGGRVGDLPGGSERGTFHVTLAPGAHRDPLLHGLPATFPAYLSHRQAVLEPPAGAQVLGGSARDPHQILRYGPAAFSVQFHPEFTPAIMAACAAGRENGDATPVTRSAAEIAQSPWLPSPHALLLRFVARHPAQPMRTDREAHAALG